MIHIAFAADANYLPHAAALVHSLARTGAPGACCVHLLHDAQLSPDLRRRFGDFVAGQGAGARFHQVDESRLHGLPAMGRISQVMWLRVFLAELLPDEPRVLYLDCDTLVLDDLRTLWRTDLAGAWIGAVSNVFESGRESHAPALGLRHPRDYFNSGVLLFDLDAWRRERLPQQVLDYARSRRLVWPDQDALNAVLAGHRKPLHPRWNCQNSLFYFPQAREVFGADAVSEATRAPGIIHFEGGELAKPWHYLCKHPYRQAYLDHRAQTPWPLTGLAGRTLTHRLLRPLPMALLLPTLRFIHRVQAALRRRLTLPARP